MQTNPTITPKKQLAPISFGRLSKGMFIIYASGKKRS